MTATDSTTAGAPALGVSDAPAPNRGMSYEQRLAMWRGLHGVVLERERQHSMWGEQSHPDGTGRDGDGRAAHVARSVAELGFIVGKGCWRDLLTEEVAEAFAETNPVRLRTELLQVAALAVQWVEAIDRRGGA